MAATTERARRVVDDALARDHLLVTVAARDAENEEPTPEDLYETGCVIRIVRVLKADDGSQRLWVQGLRRVRIEEYEEREPYLRARITPVDDIVEPSLVLEALHRNVREQFLQLTEDSSTVPEPVRTLVTNLEDPAVLSDQVAANIAIPLEQRQQLLETLQVRTRLERLSEHLAREHEVRRLEQDIREEVQEELSRNQREYVLREQARAIRRQLGDGEAGGDQVQPLRARLQAAGRP